VEEGEGGVGALWGYFAKKMGNVHLVRWYYRRNIEQLLLFSAVLVCEWVSVWAGDWLNSLKEKQWNKPQQIKIEFFFFWIAEKNVSVGILSGIFGGEIKADYHENMRNNRLLNFKSGYGESNRIISHIMVKIQKKSKKPLE